MPIIFRPAASIAEIRKAIDVLEAAFPNTPRRFFEVEQEEDRTLRPAHTHLAVADQRILSVVQVFPRQMWIRGQSVPMAGIGNVATHPDFRGQGLASSLLQRVLRQCAAEGFLLALLFTRIPAFFEQFGFVSVGRNEFRLTPTAETPRGEWLIFNAKDHLAEIMRLYSEFSASRTGTLCRDETYWQGQLNFADERRDRFTVLQRRGACAAYIRVQVMEKCLRLAEYAYRDSIYDLLALASAVAHEMGLRSIQLPLLPHEVLQAPDPLPVEEAGEKIMLLPLGVEELVTRFSLWDDEPESIIETLFGAGEFTYWQTDFL